MPRLIANVPASPETELELLARVLLTPACLNDVVPVLGSPEAFYYAPHRRIWEGILALLNNQKPIDVTAISVWLEDQKYLGEIVPRTLLREILEEGFYPRDPLLLASHLKELHSRREIGRAGEELISLSSHTEIPIEEVKDQAQKIVWSVTNEQTDRDLTTLESATFEYLDLLESRATGTGSPVIPTNLYDLDHMLGGGLRAGTLTTIMGRPAMGKSSAMFGLARSVANLGTVAIFSLEMTRDQIIERMVSAIAGIPVSDLVKITPESTAWEKLGPALSVLSAMPVVIDDSYPITVHQIAAKLRQLGSRLKQSGKPPLKLVVIDYLQLLCSGSSTELVSELSRATKALVALAKELSVPIVLLSQINRSNEKTGDKRPTLSDGRGAGTIEEDSAVVIGLYREGYYTPSAKPFSEWIVLKNRFGPTGTVKLLWVGERMEFRNCL